MQQSTGSRHQRHPLSHYAREIRAELDPAIFQPAPARLLWLPLHLAIILAIAVYVVQGEPPWWLALAAAILAGHSWGCLGFLAHEAMHHGLTRSRWLERVAGYSGFGIYCLSPLLWEAWHNQAHHGNAGKAVEDPDTFGMLTRWQASGLVRWLVKFAPGSGYKRSTAFVFFWFAFHAVVVLLFHSERQGYFQRISRRTVYAETAAMIAFWLAVLFLIGWWSFLFVYVVPMLVANATVMAYISTNHFLNSYTGIDDPLANTLSVTGPRWLESLHLQFGYHVEHHLFPRLSGRHAPVVRDVLVRRYGDRYLRMRHWRALRLLYTRPKIHLDHDTLIDPRTMTRFNTLAPDDLSMSSAAGQTS